MNDWRWVLLGEIARPKQWHTLTKSELSDSGYPVYGANGPIGHYSSYTHEEPTILIGCRGSCGTIHVTPPQAYANGNAMALDALDTSVVDIHFVAEFLRWRGFADVITGTSQPQIIAEHLRKVRIPVPPLPEQRRIAIILNKAGALREKRLDALAHLERLAQSTFIEMFGHPATNPMNWDMRPLKGLGRISTGGTPPSAEEGMFGGDIPFVTPGDLESDFPVRRTLTDDGARRVGTVRPGTALVCCIGATIGKMGMASASSAFNQQLNAVEWFEDIVDDAFGLAALRFFKPTIVSWGSATTLPILKKSSFEKIEIPVPPIDMQQEFGRRMRSFSAIKAKYQEETGLLKTLSDSLQNRAFRGTL